jgi:signal transduction histidine kinase
VRLENSADVAGTVADAVRASGIRSAIGVPIVVGGEVWGMITGGAVHPNPLADDIEDRLAAFTELVATAIADAESRAGLARLAEEQAALRRVATVVARRASSTAVFTAIAEEVGRLLGAEHIRIVRFEDDRDALVMATWGESDDVTQVGARIPLGGDNATSRAFRTRKPARIDDYRRASGAIAKSTTPMGLTGVVAMPVLVGGRLWGVIAAATTQDEPLPADTESRTGQFAELMAIAIANTEAHARADRLAEEQAALRRVATLVARESPPAELFAQVVEELANVFGETECLLFRDEGDGTASVVASKGKAMSSAFPVDTRLPTDGDSVTATVLREGRPHRVEAYSSATGTIAKRADDHGARSGVGCPIRVHGRIWGAIGALRYGTEPFPPETETRITEFADLVAMAIANAEARDQLRASRERLLTEGDEARRRLVRDLHDGAQQRQVHTIITLKLAQQALRANDPNAEALVAEALDHAQQGTEELRELAHGILPTALTGGGVPAAVDTLVARLDLPVEVDAAVERLPPAIEATAYFLVAEALTNVVKHARATQATVTARIQDGCLHVEVRDDGVGGARLDGSGLLGLADRLAVLDGRLRVESPAGGGTLVAADIPIPGCCR